MQKTLAPVVWPSPSRAEAAFAEDFLPLFRAAGGTNACRVLDHMADASEDGACREDFAAMLREALYTVPACH